MYVKVSSLIFCFSDKAVDCGRLSPPMNGSLLSNETTYPNEVEISCDEGFIVRGSFRRKCQADKTWSGESVFCEGNKFMCTYLKLNVSFGLLNPDLTFWTKKKCFSQNEKLQNKVIRDYCWDFVQTVSWVDKHSLQFKLLRSSVRLSVLKILSSSTQSPVFRNIPTDLGVNNRHFFFTAEDFYVTHSRFERHTSLLTLIKFICF